MLRFLWIDDINRDMPRVVMLKFTRVVFGVFSSPFLINATIKHHLECYRSVESSTISIYLIHRSIYVDDISYGTDNVEDAYQNVEMLVMGGRLPFVKIRFQLM